MAGSASSFSFGEYRGVGLTNISVLKNIEVEEAGFDGFDAAPVVCGEFDEGFDAVELGV